MTTSHRYSLQVLNAPSVLPRLLLILSRRRVTPLCLHMEAVGEWAQIEFQIDGCSTHVAGLLLGQMQRVVEVRSARLTSGGADLTPRAPAPAPVAADGSGP